MDEDREYLDIEETAEETEANTPSSGHLKTVLSFIGGIIFAVAAFLIVTQVLDLGTLIPNDKLDYYHDLDTAYGKYYEIVKMIGEDPIAESTPEDITEEDLRALLASSGDPYAQYYTAEEYEKFYNSFAGGYVGIGIGVVETDDGMLIKTVFNNGPAEDAGVEPEDLIVKINGKVPESIEDAVSMMTGEVGEKVVLTINRAGKELEFTMNKQELDQESVAYTELEGYEDIGYITITSFVKETDRDFKLAVKDLINSGRDKIIIDLRDNGGGLTDSSVEIADYLLPSCTIMTDVLKDGTETVYSSKQSSADIEYVILVNEYTASASEILSAAVQDNNGGKIIGSQTFGKGVTQITRKFSDGSAVKLTISEYYRPNGDKVQGVGVTPDIETDTDEETMAAAIEVLED